MEKIYLLQIMCNLDEEMHYENVYSTKEKAVKQGKEKLDMLLRKQHDDWFEDDKGLPKLTHEQLFKLKAVYDFTVTEYNPKFIDSLTEDKLLEVKIKSSLIIINM